MSNLDELLKTAKKDMPECTRPVFDRLMQMDEETSLILKGHLLIEKMMTITVELSAVCEDFIDHTDLSFAQKAKVIRSLSYDGCEPVWDLLDPIDRLKNDLCSQESDYRRKTQVKAIKTLCSETFDEKYKEMPDETVLVFVFGKCLGFLTRHAFELWREKLWMAGERYKDLEEMFGNGEKEIRELV